jgi:hypothetical protein
MASQSPDQTTASAEAITFEVEKMATDGHGRLVVTGRWYGVRGRRFMRPTLTLTMREDGAERRALADLEHKPWAPEDAKSWIAAFPLEVELGDASEVELAVAPDIAVDLADSVSDAASGSRGGSRGGRGARGGRSGRGAQARSQPPTAREARAPRVRAERVQARPSTVDHAREIERLKARASTAEQATEREHARRGAVEQALEQERAESLKLRSELGRIRAELDIAATTRTELAATSAELDKIRSEAREAGGRLQATVRALDQQRAESERLRMRLTAAEATIKRLTDADAAAHRQAAAEARTTRVTREPSREPGHSRGQPDHDPPADPDATASYTPVGFEPELEPGLYAGYEPGVSGGLAAGGAGRVAPRPDSRAPRVHGSYAAGPERRRNPSLRSRPSLAGRALALLVILGVLAAIFLVVHSTIA